MKCTLNCAHAAAGWMLVASLVVFSGCGTPDAKVGRTDPDIARAAHVARMAFERGSIAQAERLYERALRLARAQDDTRECGTLAYNLAVCRAEQGRLDDALSALLEARADYERTGRVPDEIVLLEAEIKRQQKRYEEGLAMLSHFTGEKDKRRIEPEYRALAWLVRSKIEVDRGDTVSARASLKRARSLLRRRVLSSEMQAQFERTDALIAESEGRWSDSAAAYDREAEVWRWAKQFRRMAVTMGLAANAYKQAGSLGPALERYYLAARSLAAQGDELAALKLIEAALDVAEKRVDSDEARLLIMLFERIKSRTETP